MKSISLVLTSISVLAAGLLQAMTVDVAEGVTRTITAEEAESLISSNEDLIKTGAGRFEINRDMSKYKGEVRVQQGYLRCTASYALGDATKPAIISDGATLEFGSNDALYLSPEKKFGFKEVQVSGAGVDGCGALCHVGLNKEQWVRVFGRIVLNGDTTFGGLTYNTAGDFRRFDIRGSQGQLVLNGHTLTVKCYFGICGADVIPGETGRIVVDGAKASMVYENSSAKFNGSAANVIELRNGATLRSQNGGPAIAWSLLADDGVFQDTNGSNGETSGRIDGPVTVLGGGLMLKGSTSNGRVALGGKISGTGRITVSPSVSGFVALLLDPSSDWTGGLTVIGSKYPTVYAAALPNATVDGLYSVEANATLYYVLTADDPTGEAIAAYANMITHNQLAGTHRMFVAKDSSVTSGVDATAEMGVLRVDGEGELVLNGNQDRMRLYALGGTTKVTGTDKEHRFNDINVGGTAALKICDAGRIYTSTNRISIGSIYPALPRMTIENTLYTTNWEGRVSNSDGSLFEIGPKRYEARDYYSVETYAKSRGILEVGPGAVVTNIIWAGRSNEDSDLKKSVHGSVFVHGGSLTMIGPNNFYNFIGYRGSGYFEQTAGSTAIRGLFYPGAGQRGRGSVMVSGGDMRILDTYLIFGQYSRLSNPGIGVFYQKGGTVSSTGAVLMGKTLYDTSNAGSRNQIAVAGGTFDIDYGLDMGGEPDSVSILNLNGGLFRCHYIQVITNELQSLIGSGSNRAIANSYAYVNFDGGTFRYRRNASKSTRPGYKSGGFFYGDPERIRITSYGKGAAFDTYGYTVTNTYAITAPTGQGIVSISLPGDLDLPDWAFAGAPVVEIEGDGTGASAVAEFDSTSGRITGITVTSPGCDYTSATAKLARGGFTNDIDLVVSLGTPIKGGLTKKGDGTLRMESANTYGGATRVEEGVLAIANENAIPAGNDLEIAGGTLDAGGYAKAYGAISATSGELKNAAGSFTAFTKTGSGRFLFNSHLESTSTLDVREGSLVLPVVRPGLVFGEKIYEEGESRTEYDNRIPLSGGGVELTPSKAYELCVNDGYYQPRHYVSYSGYVWNRGTSDVTWTFAYSFDDNLEIRIDGKEVLGTRHGTLWGALCTANVTLSPGPHAIHLVLWNAQGNGGAVSAKNVSGAVNWNENLVGLAYDPQGRGSTNGLDYVHMVDPGDGSLFTTTPHDGTTIPAFSSIKLASGASLDVNGGIYTYGDNLHMTVDALANPIQVSGGIAFAPEATVTIDGLDELSKDGAPYLLMHTTEGVSGTMPVLESGWRLKRGNGGKDLLLDVQRGAVLLVR